MEQFLKVQEDLDKIAIENEKLRRKDAEDLRIQQELQKAVSDKAYKEAADEIEYAKNAQLDVQSKYVMLDVFKNNPDWNKYNVNSENALWKAYYDTKSGGGPITNHFSTKTEK